MPRMEVDRVYQLVEDGFTTLGVADPQAIQRTVLLRDRNFAGHRFHCDGLQAVCLMREDSVCFYDSRGQLLKEVPVDRQVMKKAA